MFTQPKISIIGAGGNVGAATAQYLALKELGELVLIDVKDMVAKGRASDLAQSGVWAGFSVPFKASAQWEDLTGSHVVVLTAGIPRKPGQTREELIQVNAQIVKDICQKIKQFAPEAILIVVSNPLDAMVYVAKAVTGFPRERVVGSAGILDSARFCHAIATVAEVNVKDVKAIVLGAHTDKDMVPIISTAHVGGIPLTALLAQDALDQIVSLTKNGGAELTKLIGTSAWLAPGASTALMVESILRNQKRVLPCSVELNGEFGLKDCFLGVPTLLSQRGAEKVFEFPLSAAESKALGQSAAANRELMTLAKTFL